VGVAGRQLRRETLKASGLASADASESELDRYDAMTELLANVVNSHFPGDVRDEFGEIERWHRVFEFDGAGYSLFPGTWTGQPLPIPDRRAEDFLNASWARAYLPIRLGSERLALRLILGGKTGPLDPEDETRITALIDELEAFRAERFGDKRELIIDPTSAEVSERVQKLASWTETVPTDGLHIEAVLAATTALDVPAEQMLNDEIALRQAGIAEQIREAELKQEAAAHLDGASTTIAIATDGE
jgi:hypothetical protein